MKQGKSSQEYNEGNEQVVFDQNSLLTNAYHFTSEQCLWFFFRDKKCDMQLTDKGKLIVTLVFNSPDYGAVGSQAFFHSWYSSL